LTLSPSSQTIGLGDRVKFNAFLNGTPTTGVSWQILPLVGNIISDGTYIAPTSLSGAATITVTARLLSNSSVLATASVTVIPNISISISPANTSVNAGASTTLTATVTGTTNTAVMWNLNPWIGSIQNGVYTAPASVSQSTVVRVIATSMADTSRVAVAFVTVNPAPQPVSNLRLPIEVFGANGTVTTASFPLTSTQVTNARTLFLQIHGLDFETEASVQINNGPWTALNSLNYQLFEVDRLYGGIGGGYSTLRGRVTISSSWLVAGTNTIRFRFNQTDGFTHGFRVLDFNLQDAAGSNLLAANLFEQDNPASWQPPLPDATSINRGKWLWYNANLSTPLQPSIKAKCADCHTQDGRDLKYFNYSNYSIRTRAQFHGLSAADGDAIASYIRSLPVAAPGRPWNPPYQPGPGVDSRPVSEWAAGAGLRWVMNRDQDAFPHIFPSGFEPSRIAPTANLSAREIPTSLQLPDWNHWLPQIHPKDAIPGFDGSKWNQNYLGLRGFLKPGQASTYLAARESLMFWANYRDEFLSSNLNSLPWTEWKVRVMYSGYLWHMVKAFELNQEFSLEGLSRAWFGPQADDRAWMGMDAFATAPHFIKIPMPSFGLRNGSAITHQYTSLVWYHLQLILNNSNKAQYNHFPIDWPYSMGAIMHSNKLAPHPALMSLWMAKAMQISENGIGPENWDTGWRLYINQVQFLTHFDMALAYRDMSPADRNRLVEMFWTHWINKVRSFSPQQFYQRQTSPLDVPSGIVLADGNFPSKTLDAIRTLKRWGANPSVIRSIAETARTLWPNYNWLGEL
jgi:cytochrome c553